MQTAQQAMESITTKSKLSWFAIFITVLFAFAVISSLILISTVVATNDDVVRTVELDDWETMKESFKNLFGTAGVTLTDQFVQYRSGTYTHLRITKNGDVSSHMPLHSLTARQKTMKVQFNTKDKSVTILGHEVDYTYRKP